MHWKEDILANFVLDQNHCCFHIYIARMAGVGGVEAGQHGSGTFSYVARGCRGLPHGLGHFFQRGLALVLSPDRSTLPSPILLPSRSLQAGEGMHSTKAISLSSLKMVVEMLDWVPGSASRTSGLLTLKTV